MKNGSFALCAAAVVAIFASAANAFSSDNLVADSFFPGQALTLGKLEATNNYAKSAVDASYSECASCAGDAAAAPVAAPVFFNAGIPAQVVYNDFAPFPVYDSFDYGFGYGYDYGWTPVRNFARPVVGTVDTVLSPVVNFFERVRPVRRVINGVRNVFANDFNYLRPAYVCDPCWSCGDVCDTCDADWAPVADPCTTCGIPAAVVPTSVYAPKSCCGYGYYPGEVNELDPKTGLVKGERGINATLDSNDDSAKPSKLADKKVVSTDDAEDASDDARSDVARATQPADLNSAIPAQQPLDRPIDQYDSSSDGLDSQEPAENGVEILNTPQPDPLLDNKGVIRMLVPSDAIVYVNGYRTKMKGEVRTFAARDLEEGQTYSFEIRVVAQRDGVLFEDVKTTKLTAGETSAVAFNLKPVDNSASYAQR